MIKCYLVLCVIGTAVCKPPVEIVPDDGHLIASPMECLRGSLSAYTATSPDPTKQTWFPKVYTKQIGDGRSEIQQWLSDQRDKRARLSPQIR